MKQVWFRNRSAFRKSIIILVLMISSIFFVSIVYAANYNAYLTETIKLSQSSNDRFINPIDTIALCVNTTTTAFNNCGTVISFTLSGAGTVSDISLSGCNVSPTTISGNGNPVPLKTSPSTCDITATGVGVKFLGTGNGIVSFNGNTETLKACPTCHIGDSYSTSGGGQTQTQTVIVFQTVVIPQNVNPCTNAADCGSNQLGAFISSMLPSLIIILIALYATYKVGGGNVDERAYIFTFMFAVSADGFLSSVGAFGTFGIPWYIAIFCDIVGFMVIIFDKK